jgi:hypothetical protein
MKRIQLFKTQKEFEKLLLGGRPTHRRIWNYKFKFRKGDLVRIKEMSPYSGGFETNYTFLKKSEGNYFFNIRHNGEEFQFDDDDLTSNLKVMWILRGTRKFRP